MRDYTSINQFAKLSLSGKKQLLDYAGVLLHKFPEDGNIISVYRLLNFFIEVSRCSKTGMIVEITPLTDGIKADAQGHYKPFDQRVAPVNSMA